MHQTRFAGWVTGVAAYVVLHYAYQQWLNPSLQLEWFRLQLIVGFYFPAALPALAAGILAGRNSDTGQFLTGASAAFIGSVASIFLLRLMEASPIYTDSAMMYIAFEGSLGATLLGGVAGRAGGRKVARPSVVEASPGQCV